MSTLALSGDRGTRLRLMAVHHARTAASGRHQAGPDEPGDPETLKPDNLMEFFMLEERLKSGTAAVTVMGLGYVGLPVALAFVRSGCRVYGLDIDRDKVQMLSGGKSYLKDISDEEIQSALDTGRFRPSTDPSAIAGSDAILICVPTPVTPQKEPDTSYISRAAEDIAKHLRPRQVIILRSTSYPGTTNEVVRPILERAGLRAGRDFFLAFAPERIDPGTRQFSLEQVPVVVGGTDPLSTRFASLLLCRIAKRVVPVSSPEAAEMTKLLENVFRNVNIALVNQVAQLCGEMGLDVWEIVEAAATKPYGFMSFKPGLVGGHCIPVDPYFLAWKAREYDFHMDFIELAARVNESMPAYVVNRLIATLHDNSVSASRILVLGVAFKKDVDDARYSPALKVIELLRRRRFNVVYHDPYVAEVRVNGGFLRSEALTPGLVSSADCVLILTDHSCFDYGMIVENARLVFDVRNATRHVARGKERIVRL